MKFTSYPEINKLLDFFITEVKAIFGEDLVGIYLMGSLSYGDFNIKTSDIDLQVILKNIVSVENVKKLEELVEKIKTNYPTWSERVECSFLPQSWLTEIHPPKSGRPYIGQGKLYPLAIYGHEWIINQYLCFQYGIPLIGADFKSIVGSVDMKHVKEANVKDLKQELEPRVNDDDTLKDPHIQAYTVLNLCRILYLDQNVERSSKKVAADWVKTKFPQWKVLIDTALAWEYGKEMNMTKETQEFIKFVLATTNT